MEFINQVTSQEISEKIKKLGVKQESLFYWVKSKANTWHLCLYMPYSNNCYDIKNMQIVNKTDELISAYTCSELGEILPRALVKDERIYYLRTDKDFRNDILEWSVRYECDDGYMQQVEKTEADARGKVLIMLLENRLIPLN